MQRIYILGETTYDIIFKDNKPVEAKVGGSQLNTAVSLGRLKLSVSFITQTGTDRVGNICFSFIRDNGIDTSLIKRNHGNSRLALAFLDENNNAGYDFFMAENSKLPDFPDVQENDIILFGSSFSIREDIRQELTPFLNHAKEKKAIVIYDPNFRKNKNINQNERLQLVKENMQLSTIVKGSDDDFINIFGEKNPVEVWKQLSKYGVKALFYTANKNGVYAFWGNNSLFAKVPKINPISTIGAGDNFNAGIIYSLVKTGVHQSQVVQLSKKDFHQIIQNATKFAQEVCLSYDNYLSLDFAKTMI